MSRPILEKAVALVCRYESVAGLMRNYLSSRGYPVLWETTSDQDAQEKCIKKPPRLLIISTVFRAWSAPELTQAVRSQNPNIKILFFSDVLHRDLVQQMISAQVHGIVSASSPLSSLLTAIDILMDGGCYFDSVAESYLYAPKANTPPLSVREKSVLRLIADGLSTKEVANALGICVKTAEKFRERVMKKLNLHDVVQLTRYAIRNGISSLD